MRSSRYAMVIENLQVQNIQEEEETKNCIISSAEEILEIIQLECATLNYLRNWFKLFGAEIKFYNL